MSKPRPLGKKQLELLLSCASPSSLLVVGDGPVEQSLVQRELLAPKLKQRPKAWLRITPAGMRALADALESGLLDQFFKWPKGLES